MKTERNTTMQLVMPDDRASFSFKIYYDGITKTQLDELIWTLTLGENKQESRLRYKIGHGKPIGLGSAKILISSKTERIFDPEKGYTLVTEEYKEKQINAPLDFKYIKELRTIMDMDASGGKQVSYPFIDDSGVQVQRENDKASHRWFNKNYHLGNRNGADQPWKGILTACAQQQKKYSGRSWKYRKWTDLSGSRDRA